MIFFSNHQQQEDQEPHCTSLYISVNLIFRRHLEEQKKWKSECSYHLQQQQKLKNDVDNGNRIKMSTNSSSSFADVDFLSNFDQERSDKSKEESVDLYHVLEMGGKIYFTNSGNGNDGNVVHKKMQHLGAIQVGDDNEDNDNTTIPPPPGRLRRVDEPVPGAVRVGGIGGGDDGHGSATRRGNQNYDSMTNVLS